MMMMAGFVDHKRRSHESCFDGSLNSTSNTTSDDGVRAKKIRTDVEGSVSTKEKKDKIGERIAALQQLVSPFGKSDTASVLQEASGYIKFLHDQVKVLSGPYLRTMMAGKMEEAEYYSLRNRGLCLMPIATTFGIGQSNGADLWTPVYSSKNP